MKNEEKAAVKKAGAAEEMQAAPVKKRPGRKPMSPEEKAAAAKKREEEKMLAENLKPAVYVQFEGGETEVNDLVERAKAEFRKEKKRARITDMKVYVVPAEHAAYYVINEKVEGKVEY